MPGSFYPSALNRLDHQSSLLHADHDRRVGAESSLSQPVAVEAQAGAAGIVRGHVVTSSLTASGKSGKRGAKPRIGVLRPAQQNTAGKTSCKLLRVQGKCCCGGEVRNG